MIDRVAAFPLEEGVAEKALTLTHTRMNVLRALNSMQENQGILLRLVKQEGEWVGQHFALTLQTGAAAAYLLLQNRIIDQDRWPAIAKATGNPDFGLPEVTAATTADMHAAIHNRYHGSSTNHYHYHHEAAVAAVRHACGEFFAHDIEGGVYAPIGALSNSQLQPTVYIAGAALVEAAFGLEQQRRAQLAASA